MDAARAQFARFVTGTPTPAELTLAADAVVTYSAMLTTAVGFYLFMATLVALWSRVVVLPSRRFCKRPAGTCSAQQRRRELAASLRGFPFTVLLLMPLELGLRRGYGRVTHDDAAMASWTQGDVVYHCLVVPVLFLVFTETLVYAAHRIVHTPRLYWVHRLHHAERFTTTYSAFAFHPFDGAFQGAPSYLFGYIVPTHGAVLSLLVLLINTWVVVIHDTVDRRVRVAGCEVLNTAAHHSLHHEHVVVNYGQLTTFWDRVCGTYRAPPSE